MLQDFKLKDTEQFRSCFAANKNLSPRLRNVNHSPIAIKRAFIHSMNKYLTINTDVLVCPFANKFSADY